MRMMYNVYAPMFFENKSWPDSIKNEFSAQLHKFMGSLTDTKHKLDGHTVLYIPQEGLNKEPDAAARNKELVQRYKRRLSSTINDSGVCARAGGSGGNCVGFRDGEGACRVAKS